MRRPVIGTALLALVLITAPASADPSDPPPSRSDVREAEHRAEQAADDVEGIQAQIDAANADLEAASIAAQQAAEAYNGARWRLAEARRAQRQAARESRAAARALVTVKHDYRDALLTSFVGGSPDLAAFSAMLDADGLSSLLDRDATAGIVQDEFEEKRTAYEYAAGQAAAAAQAAQDAADDAAAAAEDARAAKEEAESAVAAAAAAAESVTAEKTRLLHRMARLEGISVALAEERQAALELERQERAALQAQLEQEQREQQEQEQQQEQQDEATPPAEEPDTTEPDTTEPDATEPEQPEDPALLRRRPTRVAPPPQWRSRATSSGSRTSGPPPDRTRGTARA